jgi:hypothetical protein
MMKSKGLPGEFWAEAVATTVYVLNRSPTKGVAGRTPYEVWHGKKPAVNHLRTFGCVAYVKNTTPNLKKLDDRNRPMIFVGYEQGTIGYRVYDPVSRRVRVSRDVVFDESAQWKWGNDAADGEPVSDIFTIEYTMAREGAVTEDSEAVAGNELIVGDSPVGEQGDGDHEHADGGHALSRDSSIASSDLDAYHDPQLPVKVRKLSDIVADIDEQGLQLHVVSSDEPATLAEAQADQNWKRAMEEEMSAIEDNKTWKLCELPHGHCAIGLKWVFKVKRDESGAVVKHKARLVVKGYAQRKGIDYDEVFAPVARLDTVRLLIALAADKGWEMHHLDVKSAFLNGDLQEEVYVQQPEGFVKTGSEPQVLKLKKALYGLHQAPRAWNAKLDVTLTSLGFVRSPSEPAIYIRRSDSSQLIVGVYVDDLVITGPHKGEICKFKKEMAAEFKMSDLGLLRCYLGIEVRQGVDGITLSQGAYACKILEKVGLAGCNP